MKKVITAKNIRQFASVSKDEAAIHLDDEAARKAGFEAPVAHGMYIWGLAQSLYLAEHSCHWIQSFSVRFQTPLLQGSTAYFQFETLNKNQVQVTITSDHGQTVATGAFTVMEGIAVI
jgi:3-hydroxybutyryl-CoA dehydratase